MWSGSLLRSGVRPSKQMPPTPADALVESGETARIRKHGRASAKIVPDCDFMCGPVFARVFAGYKATSQDRAAADASPLKLLN